MERRQVLHAAALAPLLALPDRVRACSIGAPSYCRELLAITAVDEGVFVACKEHSPGGNNRNCPGQPSSHLFPLTFTDERPRSIISS